MTDRRFPPPWNLRAEGWTRWSRGSDPRLLRL